MRPISAVLLVVLGFLVGCAAPSARSLRRFEFTEPQMGVPFRLVFFTTDQARANAAADKTFARIRELNAILSDYEYDSELSTLSRASGFGTNVAVGPELWFVLNRAQELSRRTDGAFDITVGPVVSLWRKARRERKLPDPTRLAEAMASVGWTNVVLEPKTRSVRLLKPSMRLDLGGIAKGYAADEALRTLKSFGISRALVAAAGDIAVADAPPGKAGWRVEIAALDVTNAPPARFVLLRHAAVSTSGDLFQHVEIDGIRYSHIVNPKTGLGLTDHSLVSIIARDGITADSHSKPASVLPPAEAMKFVEATPGLAGLIVRKPGERIEVMESSRFRKWLEVEAGEQMRK
jgi:FAD:protein FMN transferase